MGVARVWSLCLAGIVLADADRSSCHLPHTGFLAGDALGPLVPSEAARRWLPPDAANPAAGGWAKHRCDPCGRELNGSREWTIHLASRGHRAAVRKARLRQERRPGSGPIPSTDHSTDASMTTAGAASADADESSDTVIDVHGTRPPC